MNRLCIFFTFFAILLLLESSSVACIVTATQSIERQFQIPSKLSGFMVGASDFAYIPAVVFVSYFGSKGNRFKWIGVGSLMSAFSHLLISFSNFIFPVEQRFLNYTDLHKRFIPSEELLRPNVELPELLDYVLVKDRINDSVRADFLTKAASLTNNSFHEASTWKLRSRRETSSISPNYAFNEPLLSQIVQKIHAVIDSDVSDSDEFTEVKSLLRKYITERTDETSDDLNKLKSSIRAPFAYCSKFVNEMRKIIRMTKCGNELRHKAPIIVLFIGILGFGVGRTMPWSLGIPLLDDYFSKKNLPAFIGGTSSFRILGPVTGFLIGSFSSSFYYTLKAPAGLSPKDPTWIGAWWLGFMLSGLLMIGPSLALYFFPVLEKPGKIPKHSSATVKDDNCAHQGGNEMAIVDKHCGSDAVKSSQSECKVKELLKAYKEILQSKAFVGYLVARSFDLLAFRGYMVYLPKYYEMHYGLAQHTAHILMAICGIFGFALGAMFGGMIVRRYKFNGRGVAILVLIFSLGNAFLFISKAFLGCYSTVSAIGANGRFTNYNYTQACNANCGCESAPLYPICDRSGYAYFSPCHAGCHDVKVIDLEKHELEFLSCECKPGEVLSKKNCQDDCSLNAKIFFTHVLVGSFFIGSCLVPGVLLVLRSVSTAHRSIALGFQGFIVSLFATLPSPLLWGIIVDTTCLVWSYTCPDTKGSCAIYEPVLLRHRLHFTYAALRFGSAVFDLYVIKHARNIRISNYEDVSQTRSKSMSPQVIRQSEQSTCC